METKNTQPIFPWYRERLQTKYLKVSANKISSAGGYCHFTNLSLDDFSDCSSVLSGAQRDISGLIFNGTPNHNSSQKPRKCISKEHACFSKQMIQKQIRREYVAAVEEELKQHPLAMYPFYKEDMTPELFDKVVSVLDPDMCVNSASALPTPTEDHAEDEGNCKEPRTEEVERTRYIKSSLKVQSPTPRNPYILQINANGMKKGQRVKENQPSANEDMKAAAKLFSKWFASSEEETNVTEPAILPKF